MNVATGPRASQRPVDAVLPLTRIGKYPRASWDRTVTTALDYADDAENLAGAVWDRLAGEDVDTDYLRRLAMQVIGTRGDYPLRGLARDLAFEALAALQDGTPESRDRLAKASRTFERQRLNRT